MAEPSLGYALGLNVKRQDIFAPAAKALSQNLANWNQEKAQAKREKEAKASKVMAEMMKFDPSSLNRKVRLEATADFEKSVKELESAIESDESEMNMLAIVRRSSNRLAKYKDQSDNRNALEQQARTNPDSVPTVLRNYLASNVNDLTQDEAELLPGFGITYDPDTKIITSFGFKPTDIRASLNSMKPTEEEMLVASTPEQLRKNAEVIKIKSGYSPIAFVSLTPDQQRYALTLANVMDKDPGTIGSVSEEVLRREYGGDYNRYLEATKNKLNELKAQTKEGEDLPTPLDAQRAIGMDYMIKTHAPEWIQASTRTVNLNEPPKGGSPGETKKPPSTSEITNEPQINQKGMNALAASGLTMSVEDAVDMYLGKMPTDPETKKKLNKALNGNVFGSMPTIAFQSGTAEVVSLGLEQVNPRKMFYDVNKGKFYLLYDQAVALGGYTEPLTNQVREINPSEMKQLQKSKQGKDLAIWDELAPNLNIVVKGRRVNVPRTEDYIQGRRASSSAPAAPAATGSTFNWSEN